MHADPFNQIKQKRFSWNWSKTVLLAPLVFVIACDATRIPSVADPAQSVRNGLLNSEGEVVISNPNTIVNHYAAVTADVNIGDTKIELEDKLYTQPTHAFSENIKPGDLVLIVQCQGAAFKYIDDETFGEVVSLDGPGKYEFAVVKAINKKMGAAPIKSTLEIDPSYGSIQRKYSANAAVQVIHVPRYKKLTIEKGASIVSSPWSSESRSGGMVVLQARQLQLNGRIDVSGAGFPGGGFSETATFGLSETAAITSYVYTSAENEKGTAKGIGIVSDKFFGRGALANAGGGGNFLGAGGGGGANASNGSSWNGRGVMILDDTAVIMGMETKVDYRPAWTQETKGMTPFSTSSGGGRGGYSFADPSAVPNPFISPPGDMVWGGNHRRSVGGLGGRGLKTASTDGYRSELFMGGGGGAGHTRSIAVADRLKYPNGGQGGGVVMLFANVMDGAGTIDGNGAPGAGAIQGGTIASPDGFGQSGAGGGGGGGTVFLRALETSTPVKVSARGGVGGNQQLILSTFSQRMAHGPGGGGGGGYIAQGPSTAVVPDVLGGRNGVTNALIMSFPDTPFFPNGATQGGSGLVETIPAWSADLAIDTRFDASKSVALRGGTLHYTVEITNKGLDFVSGAKLLLSIGNGLNPWSYDDAKFTWTCEALDDLSLCHSPKGENAGSAHATAFDISPYGKLVYELDIAVPSQIGCEKTVLDAKLAMPVVGYVDPVLANNVTSTPVDISRSVLLRLSKANPFVAGEDPVDYRITVDNKVKGCMIEKDLLIQFPLPEGSRFVDMNGGDAWDCTVEEEKATCRQKPDVIDLSEIQIRAYAPADKAQFEAVAWAFGVGQSTPLGRAMISVENRSPAKRVFGGGGFACSITTPVGMNGTSNQGLFVLAMLIVVCWGFRRVGRAHRG